MSQSKSSAFSGAFVVLRDLNNCAWERTKTSEAAFI